jgi:hypothetical protein
MRQTILDQDIILAEDKRLIKRLWKVDVSKEFPIGLEFAYQFLYFSKNEWIQIVRIDNQLHKGKSGVHIHTLNSEEVQWTEMGFEESEITIIKLANKIIEGVNK